MSALDSLQSRYTALLVGFQPAPPPNDPYVLTSAFKSVTDPLVTNIFPKAMRMPALSLGSLPLVPTNDYNLSGRAFTQIFGSVGSATSPTTDPSAVAIFQKTSNYNVGGVNVALYASHVKLGTGNANEASALFGEGIDNVGGAQSSVIGVRGHGQLNGGSLGSPVGGSFYATIASSVSSFQNGVGIETAIENLYVDAPYDYSTSTMTAAVLAGNTGTKKSDAGFITNPFLSVPFRNGVLITQNSVSDAAFRSLASSLYGLDLGKGSQSLASIRLPNSFGQQSPSLDNRDSSAIPVAAGGSALLGAGVAGLFVITNITSQTAGVYAGDAATNLSFLGGSAGWVAPTKTPGTGQCSVIFDITGIKIFNGYSTAQSFRTITIANR